MESLNSNQLKNLYSDFVKYRDIECGGMSDMSIKEFWQTNKEKYENPPMNMCDGCARNLPIVAGLHREMNGVPVTACSAGLYA